MNEPQPQRQAAADRDTAQSIVTMLVNGELQFDRSTAIHNHTLFAADGFGFHRSTAPVADLGMATLNDVFSFTLTVGSLGHLDWDTGDGTMHGEGIQDGEQFLWLANSPTYACWEKPLECLALLLSPSFLGQAAQETIDPDRIEVLGQSRLRDPLVASLGHTLHQEYLRHGHIDKLYGETLANALAVHTLRNYITLRPAIRDLTKRGLGQSALRCATVYITDNLDSDLSLTEIAASVHLSPYHFARLFKLSTGKSVHRYVIQTRVERAKSLLKQGKLTVGEVAQAVGFYDHAHFIRHFKRIVGVNPSAFRK